MQKSPTNLRNLCRLLLWPTTNKVATDYNLSNAMHAIVLIVIYLPQEHWYFNNITDIGPSSVSYFDVHDFDICDMCFI